jgi:hypothetical protein
MTPLDAPSRSSRSKKRPHSSYNRAERGTLPVHGVPVQCQFCTGQTFRRSRLRSEDFWQLIFMRYPVRCLRCSQRQGVSFAIAGISGNTITPHSRPIRAQDTWKNWTEPAADSSVHPAEPSNNPEDTP